MVNLRLDTIFLRIAPVDIAFLKFLFETYEEVAIVRTLDRRAAVLVVLACNDYLAVAREILRAAADVVRLEEIPPPDDMGEDWLMKLMQSEE
jgi:hypothetical protein